MERVPPILDLQNGFLLDDGALETKPVDGIGKGEQTALSLTSFITHQSTSAMASARHIKSPSIGSSRSIIR